MNTFASSVKATGYHGNAIFMTWSSPQSTFGPTPTLPHSTGSRSPFGLESALPTIEASSAKNTPVASNISAKAVKATTQKSDATMPLCNQVQPITPGRLDLQQLPTPVKVNVLSSFLRGYDSTLSAFLINGFTLGFSLGCINRPLPLLSNNHSSVRLHPDIVKDKIDKEILLGRVSGPYSCPPFTSFMCSPLGLVNKKEPNSFRLIHDLSFPLGQSVNAGIPDQYSCVQYDSVETVINLVKAYGSGALMAKTDIQDAFRIIPIHPQDYPLLGFQWNGSFYYDRCLPMGASSSCQIFEAFSSALQWIMINKFNAVSLSHMLDDFFFIGSNLTQKCVRDLNNFIKLCALLGVPIKEEKTVQPTTVITIYGIEVDSILMESRLPAEKISKLTGLLQTFSRRRKVTLRELQSLLGLLNFACSVIPSGRAFLRRLYDLTCNVKRPHHKIHLSIGSRADIKIWLQFISHFNGSSVFLHDTWLSSDRLALYTDAAGNSDLGYAAVLGPKWFANKWSNDMAHYQIAVKELFPIVLALELWGASLKNKKLLFLSDNSAVVAVINKQSCRDKILMRLVRRLVLAALCNNIWFCAKHIPGKHNIIADKLSRLQFQTALHLAPWLDRTATQVPDQLLTI